MRGENLRGRREHERGRAIARRVACPVRGADDPGAGQGALDADGRADDPDLFRPENAPRHLRFLIEVLGDGGQGRRRRARSRGAAGAARWTGAGGVEERHAGGAGGAGVGAHRAHGMGLRRARPRSWCGGSPGWTFATYPAIVDNGKSVDLALLESSAAAEDASRKGVRRLFTLAARRELVVDHAASPSAAGLARRRDAVARPPRLVSGAAPRPHRRRRLSARRRTRRSRGRKRRSTRSSPPGVPKLDGLFRVWSQNLSVAVVELDKTLAALKVGREASERARRDPRFSCPDRGARTARSRRVDSARAPRALPTLPPRGADAPRARA